MTSQYILEETTFKEGSFESVAKRILGQQRKLGALKGLSVKALDLSDSRKDRLKKAGLFSVATLAGAALATYGIASGRAAVKGAKAANGKHVHDFGNQFRSEKAQKAANRKNVIQGFKAGATGAARNLHRDAIKGAKGAYGKASDKYNSLGKKGKIGAGVGAGVAGAAALTGAGLAAKGALSKRSIIIEAKYAYGTKIFQVYSATEEQLKEGVDRQILKIVTQTVAKLKTAKEWTVKESASQLFIQSAILAESLLEETLNSQLQETFLIENYILEDDEEEVVAPEADDEELAEAYIFEDDEEEAECEVAPVDEDDDEAECEVPEADDEELAEAYIFENDDDDETEGEVAPAEEDDEAEVAPASDEDGEELAEAYVFN